MENKIYAVYGIIAIIVIIVFYSLGGVISQNLNQISTVLSHPFILLLVGTIISSVLIPTFTQRAQDRKKKIEIQIDLGREISEAITKAIAISIDITHRKDTVEDQANCVIQMKKIETDLWAYFPKENLANDWLEYMDLPIGLWSLTKNLWGDAFSDPTDQTYIDLVKKYHSKVKSTRNIDWNKLQTSEFEESYYSLRTFILEEFKVFVILVHMSKITIF